MAIALRNKDEIEGLRKASNLVAKTLDHVSSMAVEGTRTEDISNEVEKYILENGGKPSFKGLYGFPSAANISVNEVIIHGIPSSYKLKNGDVVGIDVGVELDGWFGDAAITIGVGDISLENQKLIDASRDVLLTGISKIKVGMRIKELSKILEDEILSRGYVPLKNFCGHGIGRKPHEEPSILNYVEGQPNQGPKIKNGMVFCLEPMICQKDGEPTILDDKWSVVCGDGLNGSHYEHTVAVINGKAEILSKL